MVQMKEFRVVMPLSLDEYQVAQMYMVMKMQQQNTRGTEGVVEVLENRPFEDEEFVQRGSRSFSGQNMQASRSQTSNGPLTQKPDVFKIPETSSTTVVSEGQKSSLQRDDGINKLTPNAVIFISRNNSRGSMVEKEFKSDGWDDEDSVASEDHVDALGDGQSNADRSLDFDRSVLVEDSWDVEDRCVNDVSSHFSAMSFHQNQRVDNGYVEGNTRTDY